MSKGSIYVKAGTYRRGRKLIHRRSYYRHHPKYKIHTQRWHDMVNALVRGGLSRTRAMKLATFKLGPKAFLKHSR